MIDQGQERICIRGVIRFRKAKLRSDSLGKLTRLVSQIQLLRAVGIEGHTDNIQCYQDGSPRERQPRDERLHYSDYEQCGTQSIAGDRICEYKPWRAMKRQDDKRTVE